MPITERAKADIEKVIHANKVVLFMKGNKHFPQCGFSAQVISILGEFLPKFETVNVLSDPEIRDGIKEFSSWPTIPQLYVDGQFVGGCDIIKEMHASGELAKVLGVDAKAAKLPAITMTAKAADAIRRAMSTEDLGSDRLRLEIDPQFQHDLFFGPAKDGDLEATTNGVTILLDAASAARADGVSIDFVTRAEGDAFKIENPNEPPRVKTISPREVKKWIDDKTTFSFFDVRPETERDVSKLAEALPLDDDAYAKLDALDRNAVVVFMCHHGGRSRAAAEHFLREGFRNVFNMEGGIEAWSATVDNAVPRY
jgi:monothiol glutaredoxin